jgi:hypothetical protein
LTLVGAFTGAQPQREPPYVDYVFNIRASYRQEMMALVDQFWRAGAREFGVFYQIDAYGRSGTDGVARGLARRGATIAAEATYSRGASFEDDMSLAVKALQESRVDVVMCTGAYQGCAAFIRSARDLGWNVPISNLSFVGSEALLGLLSERGRKTGRDYTRALVNSQVVPSYDDLTLPGVREYRALMDKNNPAIPHSLRRLALGGDTLTTLLRARLRSEGYPFSTEQDFCEMFCSSGRGVLFTAVPVLVVRTISLPLPSR